MAALTQSKGYGEWLLSEANGQRSRKNVVVASGQNLADGAVVSGLTTGGKVVAAGTALSSVIGILLGAVNATDADQAGVIIECDAEVKLASLGWAADQDAGEQAAIVTSLAALGIKAL